MSYPCAPVSTISLLGRHLSHGKKRRTSSHNENAETGVDTRNRCRRFPAAQCERPGVRAHGRHQVTTFEVAVSWPRHNSNEHCRCVRPAPPGAVRRKSHCAFALSSPPRVRAPRSVMSRVARTLQRALPVVIVDLSPRRLKPAALRVRHVRVTMRHRFAALIDASAANLDGDDAIKHREHLLGTSGTSMVIERACAVAQRKHACEADQRADRHVHGDRV
jgi:hypothetical protein